MLVNVKFYKIFTILILLSANLSANEKDQIVTQLNNLNSLEFTFDQVVNDKTERGNCLLEFPGKLKCDYIDDKKKELIINKKRLAITQKRYNKTYYYPISNSPFLNILYKDKLLEIVRSGEIELSDQIIKLVYLGDNEITVFFDKKTLAITQKRYNKTYYYPISNSPFLNILYKDKLLEIVQLGELEVNDQIIKLIYFGDNEITVYFDKKNLDLKGWEIKDQYNNNISFSLNIVAKNDVFKKGTFKVPEIN